MESTGVPDKIQISRTTAEQIKSGGKHHWVTPRDDIVHAKGLGAMQTFWLQIGTKKAHSAASSSQDDVTASEATRFFDSDVTEIVRQQQQLVDWIVELLLGHIKNMVSTLLSRAHDIIDSKRPSSTGTVPSSVDC
jgi:hypothetical protein